VAAFAVVEAARILLQRPRLVLYGDQALLELGARRAAHFDQLVGPYSRNGFHHPGPAVFYLLAPFVRLLEPSGPGLYLGAVVVNAVALVAIVAVVWRRAGGTAALWTAGALDVFCLCLGVGTLREPWNPYLVVVPMVLFVVLWAAGWTGSVHASVWALVVGSYEVQSHVATAPYVIVMALILCVRMYRSRDGTRRHVWLPVSALAVIWLPPFVEVVRDRPNNLQLMWDFLTSSHASTPVGKAVEASTAAMSIVPFGTHAYVLAVHRGPWELAAAAVLLVLGAVVAGRAGAPPMSRALVIAAVVGALIGTLSLTRSDGPVSFYYAVWLVCVPVAVLIAVGIGLPAPAWRPVLAVCVAAAVLAVVADLRTAPISRTTGSGPWPLVLASSPQGKRATVRDTAALAAAAESVLRPGDRLVGVTIGSSGVWPLAAGVVLELDRHDVQSTVAPDSWELYFGQERAPGRPVSVSFTLDVAGAPTGSGQHVIADVDGVVLTAARASG